MIILLRKTRGRPQDEERDGSENCADPERVRVFNRRTRSEELNVPLAELSD
ncbi:MAG: hypothetical protein ACREM1_16025 [Longimicrobiales bacterium]